MPNYPSNYSNNSPFAAGPVNNVNLLYQIKNRLLRHNLIPVTRIISNPNVVLTNYDTATNWSVGGGRSMKDWVYGITVTSGSQLGLSDGDIVVLANRTNPVQNGVFKYVLGPAGAGYAKTLFTGQPAVLTTGSTGPAFIRVGALGSGSTFPASGEAAATSWTLAQTYLNQTWDPTNYFGVTGALAVGPSGRQMLLDAAGVAYPQGFYATSGSPVDDGNSSSNLNKVIYYSQQQNVTLGTTAVDFTTVNALNVTTPSGRNDAGTERTTYNTDLLGDFYDTADIVSQLLTNITGFRESGGETDITKVKKAYLSNLSQEQIMRLRMKLEDMADDLYRLYYTIWNLDLVYLGTTGPRYPSEYNRGYQVWNTGNY